MKCLTNNLNWVVSWSVVVAMLFALGCSGTAVSPLGSGAETDIDQLGYAAEFDSNGSIYVASPPSPRQASAPGEDLLDDSIAEPIDPLAWYLAHIPLVSGENEIDVTDYLYHGDGAFVDHDDIYLNHVDLSSEPGGTSYVTYGFRNIPEGENIIRVEIMGEGYFGDDESDGLYVGISDPATDTYKWVGPFKTGEDWALNLWFMDNVNDSQRSYLTLMVADGDYAEIREMRVFVGEPPHIGFEHELLEKVLFDDPLPGPGLEGYPGPIPDPLPEI